MPILAFGDFVLFRCVSASEFSSNSFLAKVCRECIREVFLISVCSKASYMSAGCLFDFTFEFLEVCKHCPLLPHGKDPCVPREVVDEGDVVSTSSKCGWSWSPHLGGLCLRFARLEMGVDVVFPNWQASHTPSISFSLKFGSPMMTPLDCIPLSFWRLIWPILLCHSSISVSALRLFANMADFTSFDSRINIRPSLRPWVMSQPSFSMK